MEQTNRVDQPMAEVQTEQGGGRGGLWAILIVVVTLLITIGIIVGLYFLGDEDQSALERFRDITIVFIGIVWVLIVLLLAVMVGVMVWVALQIKNRVLPLLEDILANVKVTSGEVTETAKRARGTAEFVTEKTAAPLITFMGKVTKARTMARTFMVDDKRKSQSRRRTDDDQ